MQGSPKFPPPVAALDSGDPALRIVGEGAMADRIRTFPWHDTPLGPIQLWPETLVANVNLILNSALPLSLFWGPELIFIGNDATARISSRSHAETLGTPAAAIWGANWPLTQHRFELVLAHGDACHHESVISVLPLQGDARDVFIDYSLSPIFDQASIVGVFRTLEDTTESVLALRALAESNERLNLLLSGDNGFGVWDAEIQSGRVVGDRHIARLFRIDPDVAAVGVARHVFQEHIHPEDLSLMDDAALECIRTGNRYTVQFRILQTDGSYLRVQSIARCVYDEHGHAARITGLTTRLSDPPAHQEPAPRPFSGPQWDLLPLPVRSFMESTLLLLTEAPRETALKVISGKDTTHIVVSATPSDLGQLIGKQGRTVRAIRTLLLAVNKINPHRFTIEIKDSKRPPRP